MTPDFIHTPPALTWETTRALIVPSPLGELAGSKGKAACANRNESKTPHMSEPPALNVHVAGFGVSRYVWSPGRMSMPMSSHVNSSGQMFDGGTVTALTATLLNTTGGFTPTAPALATMPAR